MKPSQENCPFIVHHLTYERQGGELQNPFRMCRMKRFFCSYDLYINAVRRYRGRANMQSFGIITKVLIYCHDNVWAYIFIIFNCISNTNKKTRFSTNNKNCVFLFCLLYNEKSTSHLTRAFIWCGRRDLNPHAVRRQILSLVRLPIPPLPRIGTSIILSEETVNVNYTVKLLLVFTIYFISL